MRDTPGLARLVRRHRRALAALSAALSVLGLGMALRPTVPRTEVVVVAAADLPAGHRLGVGDLHEAGVAAQLVPAGAIADPGVPVGQVLAAPVTRGEPITALRLVGGGGWGLPPGASAVPVRATDPAVTALLSAGQRVDLLATPAPGMDSMIGTGAPAPARRIAEDVLVLAVLEPGDGSGLLGGVGDGGAPLVVVAATPIQAQAIVGADAAGGVWFTL